MTYPYISSTWEYEAGGSRSSRQVWTKRWDFVSKLQNNKSRLIFQVLMAVRELEKKRNGSRGGGGREFLPGLLQRGWNRLCSSLSLFQTLDSEVFWFAICSSGALYAVFSQQGLCLQTEHWNLWVGSVWGLLYFSCPQGNGRACLWGLLPGHEAHQGALLLCLLIVSSHHHWQVAQLVNRPHGCSHFSLGKSPSVYVKELQKKKEEPEMHPKGIDFNLVTMYICLL